jgi:hypothetical protein
VQPIQHTATLTWTASTSTVSGYNVQGNSGRGPLHEAEWLA